MSEPALKPALLDSPTGVQMTRPSLPTSSSPDWPTLLTIPAEILDKIVKEVLLNPKRSDIDPFQSPGKISYLNYFAIALVNKQLSAVAKDVIFISKGLVVLSTNWSGLGEELDHYDIPVVSDHHVTTMRLYPMRIYVQRPYLERKTSKSMVLLASDLPDLSRFLRTLGLEAPHPASHKDFAIFPFPRFSMRIKFGERVPTSKSDQIQLLRLLEGANSMGRIRLFGLEDDSVRNILPGYQGFRYDPNGPALADMTCDCEECKWFAYFRKIDADDSVSITNWKLGFATRAAEASHYDIAGSRYADVVTCIALPLTRNPAVVHLPRELKPGASLDLAQCRANLGMVEVSIKCQK